MLIRLRDLRRVIREALREAGGAWASHPVPVSRNYDMNNVINDREQLTQITARDLDDPDDLSPHLQDAINDDEYDPGPVPPVGANPYLLPDPYVKDSSPLPTPPIKR